MNTKLRILAAACAVATAALLPGAASAHTGSVTCDATGVVFHYNANFEQATQVTEWVGLQSKVVTVPRFKAFTDTWPGVTDDVVVNAIWSTGSIGTQLVHCPPAPPPPVAPPVTPPNEQPVGATTPPPAAAASPPPSPPVATPTAPPAQPKKPPRCPRYTFRISFRHGVLICGKHIVRIRIVKQPTRRLHHPRLPGVTG